ncbi:LIC_11548 family sensor histidine kinase [Leptospira bandrabouensis]|uniref:histidine kinase n=1 Tax=Leptospira bandrabouensis TaxID=2484903 RepID=A0A6H3NTH4_9LEPT|nr:ATP-binding protein [Leptospira bandrabouensis]MCG6145524.1 HAMP domain-containing protein [Leptospira bandrabouensis]MCG6152555.1 HAMP domain-containing protein [Leptospira bandrabouensis]MCG6161148.1 HAMP domain-containing protein [Leptospira bandrabouensis]MCG6164728.1 HAMP domain-containing protein [Leptospira bandrabouensis]TGN07663.1 HAMP domain-containing protein [Leptospira bandrabouensis]
MPIKFYKFFPRLSDENRYYLRDIFIFFLTIAISVGFSELVFFRKEEDISFFSKLDTYLFILIPFFILSLILSYVYRNRRNRETGKIRSSIRYRLTLAFLFVALVPSLPIFILSSNLTGRLIEGFYRVDISNALRSANLIIQNEEKNIESEFLKKVNILRSRLEGKENDGYSVFQKGIENGILEKNEYYFGYVESNKLRFESRGLFRSIEKLEFLDTKYKGIFVSRLYLRDRAYILSKFYLKDGVEVYIGQRIHQGMEADVQNIVNATSTYEKVSLWKEKIPFSVRITIATFSAAMFLIAILFSFLFARRISKPIINLANATKKVSLGESDIRLEKTEEGEMGILIDSFNQMVSDLNAKSEELMHTQRIAAWKEVAQRMAHEIKNPLTPIQLSAQRIQRKFQNPKSVNLESVIFDATETIIGQVRVLEHLVKEFSEFARMPVPVLINQNLNPILEEAVALFKDTTDIEFELKLAENLPEVFLDKRLFLGVINNLIKNAVEAIQSAENPKEEMDILSLKRKKIRIMSKLQKKALRKSIVIEIDDSGPGLKQEWKDKVFEPYFSTKENHGSGIGLAIVQKTIIDHHGHIIVEDSKLGGCKFRIELPLDNQ